MPRGKTIALAKRSSVLAQRVLPLLQTPMHNIYKYGWVALRLVLPPVARVLIFFATIFSLQTFSTLLNYRYKSTAAASRCCVAAELRILLGIEFMQATACKTSPILQSS